MLVPSDYGGRKSASHIVPTNVLDRSNHQLLQTPLCTLIVTFSDNENKDITSAHVFTTTTPQLYPQTRRTVYQNGSQMSLTSTPQSTDDERYSGYANSVVSPSLPKNIIQEVSLTYSAPYTATIKPVRHYEQTLGLSPSILGSESEAIDARYSHTYSFDSRQSHRPNSRKSDSVERLLNTGRVETEFSAKQLPFETVPYFSAQSAIDTNRTTTATTSPAIPTLNQASTVFPDKVPARKIILSESATFEELTTITTLNSQTTRKQEITTEMPTVNALTKQFEASSQKEKNIPLRPRKLSNASSTQQYAKSKSRVVIIDKSERYSNNLFKTPTIVYPKRGITTTTIVDIEPAKYGRRTEEYKIEEFYLRTSPVHQKNGARETHQYETFSEQFNNTAKQQNSGENRENIDSPVDSSPIDVVRNVIDQFETKIGNKARTSSLEQLRSVSRVDMNDNNSKFQEKIIVHQRSESQPIERVVPFLPIHSVKLSGEQQAGLVQTYEEFKTITVKKTDDAASHSPVQDSQDVCLEETSFSPQQVITPLPTADFVEEPFKAVVEKVIAKKDVIEEQVPQYVQDAGNTDDIDYDHNKKLEHGFDNIVEEASPVQKTTEKEKNEISAEEYSRNFINSDYKIKTYEEWTTTSRRRDGSQPPETPSPALYSSLSERSKSIDRSYDRRTFGSRMSRTYSEGRGLASGAYTGGLISGNLVSGMSSAGAICTTQIRDAREREKREIGLLNDRLADYIEKVRFLEAQNRCLSHDIDILRRGFSGGGHVSALFDSEMNQVQKQLDQIVVGRTTHEKNITALSAEIDVFRNKWLEAISTVKAHREDHDVDLDRLAKIEAEISLFKRKIRIVEEDVIRIRRENDGVYNEIARIRGQTHSEIAQKNERSLHVTDLLQRIKLLQTENSTRIEQELVFIRRDTTAENRDYFRHELQAAIRDIRADYEAISLRNRQDIEVWYREQIRKIQIDSGRVNVDLYKEEIISIRSTLTGVKTRLAELESRNFLLEKLITDLGNQQAEEARFFEITLAEKDAAIAKLREQCTELSIQMEKLCDHETSLRAEIERYRVLLNGANVTTHVSHVGPAVDYRHTYTAGGSIGATKVVSTTTRTHSSSNTSYTGLPASRHSGIAVGGSIGGISVGGTVGATHSAHVSGSVAGSEKRPDRVHDETGTDSFGRDFHRWYLGTISVNQVTKDFIELKNICKIRRVDVGGFRIEQSVNGNVIGTATINVLLVLDPQETLKINTKNVGQFFMDVDQFDTSIHSRTSLFNYTEPTEERGWFVYIN